MQLPQSKAGIPMTTVELLEQTKQELQSLPAKQLRVAAEFIRFLNEAASDEATAELLRIPGIFEDLAEAEREFAAGGGVPWREVRDDV
jgi:hypothetical protein